MKRIVLTGILATFLLALSISFLGNYHAAEAGKPIIWQCVKCGDQRSGGKTPPSASYGCGGDFDTKHVWQRIQ